VSEAQWLAAWEKAQERYRFRGRFMKNLNVFARLVHNAADGSRFFARRIPDGRGGSRRVLINTAAGAGKADRFVTFPLDIFEKAVVSCLKEIDPRDIVTGGDGPDEAQTLANRLAWIEAKSAELSTELLSGDVPAVVKVLRELDAEKKDLTRKLTAARSRAAHPRAERWGEVQELLDALEKPGDSDEVRVRFRSALRAIVENIWILIVSNGRTRWCAIQIWFDGGQKRRDYLVMHRPARGNQYGRQEGTWWARSLTSDDPDVANLDLRRRRDALALEKVLLTSDLAGRRIDGRKPVPASSENSFRFCCRLAQNCARVYRADSVTSLVRSTTRSARETPPKERAVT
jgi:hypothetical protein